MPSGGGTSVVTCLRNTLEFGLNVLLELLETLGGCFYYISLVKIAFLSVTTSKIIHTVEIEPTAERPTCLKSPMLDHVGLKSYFTNPNHPRPVFTLSEAFFTIACR